MEAIRNRKKLCRTIEPEADGMKLESYLRQILSFTKAQIRSMKFRENGLAVNGSRVRVTELLHEGDLLEIQLEEQSLSSAHLEELEQQIEVLYEDADVIAVWKEAGVAVHPSHGHYCDTLSNSVHTYFQKRGEAVKIRSIGRLDKDTSGIVVFAKNQVAAARLWKQKEDGIFWKEYLALCEGDFARNDACAGAEDGGSGEKGEAWHTITASIGKMENDLMRMCVSPEGKTAVTHYCIADVDEKYVLQGRQNCTLIRARIETGRTHQIRVHMASIGHPLVGDPLYGSGRTGTDGAKLCAWKTEFRQPFTGELIRLSKD